MSVYTRRLIVIASVLVTKSFDFRQRHMAV